MNEYEWRQSGKDACAHAFFAEGGYVQGCNLVSVLPGDDGEIAFFGPYEAFVAECGQVVPVAMFLPRSTGEPCTACLVRTGVLSPGKPFPDWSVHSDVDAAPPALSTPRGG